MKRNYYLVWKSFIMRLDKKPRHWDQRLILFVDHLIETKKKSTTVKSYVSEIRGILADEGFRLCENSFLLTSLTLACKLINDRVKIRLPIQRLFLELILDKVDVIYPIQPYLCRVFKAIFVAGYYGLLHISEVAAGPHQILACNVHIRINKDKILFILLTSKTHNKGNLPQTVKITGLSISDHQKLCRSQM